MTDTDQERLIIVATSQIPSEKGQDFKYLPIEHLVHSSKAGKDTGKSFLGYSQQKEPEHYLGLDTDKETPEESEVVRKLKKQLYKEDSYINKGRLENILHQPELILSYQHEYFLQPLLDAWIEKIQLFFQDILNYTKGNILLMLESPYIELLMSSLKHEQQIKKITGSFFVIYIKKGEIRYIDTL